MHTFVGLDLAWSSRKESGLCVLEVGTAGLSCRTIDAVCSGTEWFADFITALGPDTTAAIDAPLIVGSDRMAEHELGRVFGRYKAGAYVVTPSFLAKSGTAGPELAEALRARGFSLDPSTPGNGGRLAVEVYPHAAHVVLFGLRERLAYKKGPLAARRAGLREYQQHLAGLLEEQPAVSSDPRVSALLDAAATGAAGRALKRVEDCLDALTCAYVAYHRWRHGPAAVRMFGDAASGYILVPWREGFA